MIKILFKLLQWDLPVGDPDIDFARGMQKYPATYKEAIQLTKQKIKRQWLRTE
jgi:hypothetical protein